MKREAYVICKYTSPERGSVEERIPLSDAAEKIWQYCLLPVLRKEGASIVVSGGRGVKSREGFRRVEALAALLHAEAGASRAAAASGFAPWDKLIGINGRTVCPDLYIACGISGSLQHLHGMRRSGCILALTDDPTTPMYRLAAFAIVGELQEVLPAVLDVIREAPSHAPIVRVHVSYAAPALLMWTTT